LFYSLILCSDSQLLDRGRYTRKLIIQRSCAGDALKIHYISLEHVGVDVFDTFTPKYMTAPTTTHQSQSAVCKYSMKSYQKNYFIFYFSANNSIQLFSQGKQVLYYGG